MRQSLLSFLAYAAAGIACFGVVAVVGCQHSKGRDQSPDPFSRPPLDFRVNPPGVESATIQPFDGQSALLEVRFERGDWDGRKGVRIYPESKEVILRDDGKNGDAAAGDGIFSARIPLDLKELADESSALTKRVGDLRPRAIFRGREIIGVEDAATQRARLDRLAALRDVNALLREKIKINLFDLLVVAPGDVDPPRSLMVTDPSVVQDPTRTVDPCTGQGNANGVWTFKHLVTEMTAGTGVDPADFVEQWLKLWDSNQTVSSGFVAAPRPAMITKVLNPWPRTAAGKLDLDQAPFRLAAIVNRIDLAENLIYGGGSAGEGRFVFGVRDRTQGGCVFMPFSVIFEYGVPKSGCHDLRDWARQWVNLSNLTIGSAPYNAALEAITEQFAKAHAAPSKPNGSALNQLRTNEKALNPLWELREFKIKSGTHLLFEDTTKQTVDETLNNGTALGQYINANAAKIKLDKHVVPDHFPGASDPFMAATSRASANQLNTHFAAPGVADNDARFHFSFNSCSACHIRETSTNGTPAGNNLFLHVDPQVIPAKLSRFLTGSTPDITDAPDPFKVHDPVVTTTIHPFNDLDRRRQKLASLASSICLRQILVPPRRLLDVPRIGPDGTLPPITDPRLDGINEPIRMTH
jgi:hypothetical protein